MDKKVGESRVLAAARKAGAPFPLGEVPGERPDFRFHPEAGPIGLDVSELVRPASSNHGIVPVMEEAFHEEIIQLAQECYYAMPDAPPARLVLYFADARGKRQDKREMARRLADFVKTNVNRADPVIALSGFDVPQGFGALSIAAERGEWWCGECGGVQLSDIPTQLAARIKAKNELVPAYRANLPTGAQVWLLLYSRPSVARNLPMAHGAEDWEFPFDFERVFWYCCLENRVIEVKRTTANN